MGEMSPLHWLLVIVIALLLFGPNKLASLGKGLGEGIRNFKSGKRGDEEKEEKKEEKLEEKKP
jgi:sec-independent protein translocase protein TatA